MDNDSAIPTLKDVLSTILSSLEHGIDFASRQLPDVIHQLIIWNIWCYGFFGVIGLLFLILGLSSFRICTNKVAAKKWRSDDFPTCIIAFGGMIDDFTCIIAFGGMISTLVGFIMVCVNVYGLIEITVAPKVWLIEYALKVVHSH